MIAADLGAIAAAVHFGQTDGSGATPPAVVGGRSQGREGCVRGGGIGRIRHLHNTLLEP
jgi:hypothetical protein